MHSTTFDNTITLPKLDKLSSPYNYRISSCVLLSSPPNSTWQDLRVVIFFESVSSMVFFRLDVAGGWRWREVDHLRRLETLIDDETHNILTESGPLFFGGAISCGSKVYAKLQFESTQDCYQSHSIWSIEFVGKQEEEEEEEEVVLSRLGEPGVTGLYLWYGEAFLSESYGELFLLWFDQTIEVYRLKPESEVWERVKVVKDRAFFVGQRYCLSCLALGCGGRVYCFTKDPSSLVCYSMEDDSQVVFPPFADLPTPSHYPIWIMPRSSLRPEVDHDCTQVDNNEGSCSTRPIELFGENSTSDQDLNAGENQLLISLPFDALVEVSKHLVPLDYMNFRATSQVCRLAIPPAKWSNPLSGLEPSLAGPFLMSVDYKNDQHLYKFVDSRPNSSKCNSYLMKVPNSLENSVIRYSTGGWVLTSKEGSIDLYHAFTGEVISVVTSWDYWSVGWTHGIYVGEKFNAVISLLVRDKEVYVSTINPDHEGHWIVCDDFIILKSEKGFKEIHSCPIFFEKAFYYLDCNGNLGKLEIYEKNEEQYEMNWEFLEMPLNPRDRCSTYFFLVETGGNLLSVFVGSVGKWVSVYVLNRTQMVWETMVSLGNYALYLSKTSMISVKMSPGLGNRIYFPWVGDSGIAYFSLETGEWHFSGGGDSLRDLHGTKLHCNSCWI